MTKGSQKIQRSLLYYRCIVERCSVRMSSAENLGYHLRCHRTGSDLMFCPECDVSVVNWSSLTPHLWRQHKINIDLYSCGYCNYKCNRYILSNVMYLNLTLKPHVYRFLG